jgi:hypothetical protein
MLNAHRFSSPTSLLSDSTMAKPTFIQSVLNRPSQTYHFPPTKEYYSRRSELLRAADEGPESRPQSFLTAPESEAGRRSSMSSVSRYSDACAPSELSPSSRRSSRVSDDAEVSTPHRRYSVCSAGSVPSHRLVLQPVSGLSRHAISGRKSQGTVLSQSTASSRSNPDDRSDVNLITSSPYTPPTSFSSNTTPKQSPLPSLNNQSSSVFDVKSSAGLVNDAGTGDSEGDGDSSDEDIFYTPRSSAHSSPRNSRASAGMIIDPKALTYALLPQLHAKSKPSLNSKSSLDALTPHLHDAADTEILPVSRTSSESSLISTTSSSSAEGTVASSVTSSRVTRSTNATTPLASDYGGRNDDVRTITIARSHTRSPDVPAMPPSPAGRGQPRPLAETRRRSQIEMRRQTYTDEDWAREVRWLAPVIATKQESPHQKLHTLPVDNTPPPPLPPANHERSVVPVRIPLPSSQAKSYPPPSPSSEHRKRHTRRSRGSRSSRGRMSALLEEDESEYSDITPGGSSAEQSRSPSPIMEETSKGKGKTPQNTRSGASIPRSQSYRSARDHSRSSSEEGAESPDARLQAYARQTRKSYSNTRRLSRSISPTLFSFTQNLPTHSIPTPMVDSTTETGAKGFTSLTLPRAVYTADSKSGMGDGKIDLVRMGVAQTSMATVEVTRGIALQGPTTGPRKKRRTFSFQLPFRKSKDKGKESMTPAHLLDTLPVPVAFLLHLPPPSYVPSSHILVQVFAVGLDPLDSLLVQEKTVNGAKGAGFIPGRSIVGKAIEVGWDVKGDVCKRGEWVVGLLDVKKVCCISILLRMAILILHTVRCSSRIYCRRET